MKTMNNWEVFVTLSRLNSRLGRRLDASFAWISWNDFMVLYHLDKSLDKKMRRIDLAEKVWLTASGVTRLLLPMEKIGLVKKEKNDADARVSLVWITESGKSYLDEAIYRLEYLSEEIIDSDLARDLDKLETMLTKIYKNI